MDKSLTEVSRGNYVAHMDELQRELDGVKADLQQVMSENQALRRSEDSLRENLHDYGTELSRLELALEKEEEKNQRLRALAKRMRRREAINNVKIIQLHEELKTMYQPYLPAAIAPPAFADEDEDNGLVML